MSAFLPRIFRKFALWNSVYSRLRRCAWYAIAAAVTSAALWVTNAPASTPVHLWSQRFGSIGFDQGTAVAVDGLGNVLLTGLFDDAPVDFGGGYLGNSGNQDIFIAKYNSAGVHQWSHAFGGIDDENGLAVAVDGSGNVLVTGFFQGAINFGGGFLASAGHWDVFVVKFDAAGVHQWSQSFGSTGSDLGYSVKVDGAGNVLVVGAFQGTVNFGGVNLVSAGSNDVFVAKYNAAGVHQWSKRFGSTGTDAGTSVEVDASSNVLVLGDFQSTVNFGGVDLISAGSFDIFFAKYNAAGVHQWSKRFGNTGYERAGKVAVDGTDNVLVTGAFEGTVNFGGGGLISAGSSDIFVAKYNAAGTHQWSQRFGGAGNDEGSSVAADGSGNVLMTGKFLNTVDFGGGNRVSAGNNDIFVARYDPAGLHQWSARFGGTGSDTGASVAADGWGNVLLTGWFEGTLNFGGGSLSSVGILDIFLARFGRPTLDRTLVVVSQWTDNVLAYHDFISLGVFASAPEIDFPVDVLFGPDHNLYLSNGNQENVLRFDGRTGAFMGVFAAGGGLSGVYGIAFGPDGDLYVCSGSNDAVLRFDGTTGTFVDDFVPSGSGGIEKPRGIAFGADGDLYVASQSNSSVMRFDGTTGAFIDLFVTSESGGLRAPHSLAFGPDGNLYVPGGAWPHDDGVRRYDGVTGAFIDFFAPLPAGHDDPRDVLFGPDDNLYVSVFSTNSVLFFDGTTGDFLVDIVPSGAGGLNVPFGIAFYDSVPGLPTTVSERPVREAVALGQNYPNPFNPSTHITFELPADGHVTLRIYSVTGQLVETLIDRTMTRGTHNVYWEATRDSGAGLPSGVYFCRLTQGGTSVVRKVVLLR